MKSIVYKKENGEVRVINANLELIKSLSSDYNNPCFICNNGYATKCQKMADRANKDIARYDFITDGYQVNNAEGELQNLVVCSCKNYEEDYPRVKATTKEQLESLKRLKESIKILYLGGVDIDEANQIEMDLRRRGQLVDYDPNQKKIIK